jgi:hypothetical protein
MWTRNASAGALLLIGLATPLAAKQANDGFLYGTITTDSGKAYTGFLRWNTDEEAFWDDLFHSAKTELPYLEQVGEKDRDRGREKKHTNIKIFGFKVNVESDNWAGGASRVFIARFGDIERIEVRDENSARLTMKGGERVDVSGYANDVGATILVRDTSLGDIELDWAHIETIRFAAAPRGADPGATRLYGTLHTRQGAFTGFIQWDQEECLSDDRLDGEADDGKVALPMGSIASIERRGSQACAVTLKDGRNFRLAGTNDVNEDNRGIMVEDPRFGRVVVGWREFDRLDFVDGEKSGRGYGDYGPGKPLGGTLVTVDGETHKGRLVFDLDETADWEILNGNWSDLEYNIPFALVKRFEPGRDESRVVLRGGEELRLEESQDVTADNDGFLVFDRGTVDPLFLPYRKVESIEFGD